MDRQCGSVWIGGFYNHTINIMYHVVFLKSTERVVVLLVAVRGLCGVDDRGVIEA